MLIATLGISLVLFLAFLGTPLGLSMLLVGIGGFAWIRGIDAALFMGSQTVIDASANYGLSVLPMFILMGVFIHRSNIADELYEFANRVAGNVKGSLAQATVGSCAMFGVLTGSSIATAATMSKVAIPPMRKLGYSDTLSTGCVASAGVLGMLIPPSVPLIIFGLISDQDILSLFIAAIGPGLLVALLFSITIWVIATVRPELCPNPQSSAERRRRSTSSAKTLIPFFFLFLLVVGGMYSGVFTITEAAGIGAFGAFLIALLRRKLCPTSFLACLVDAAKTTGKLFVVVFGAMVFGTFINMTGMARELVQVIESLNLGLFGLLLVLMLMYFVLGAVLETIGVMILTVPILLPVMTLYGVDLVWFGIFVVMMIEIGMLTPPIGINVFTVSSVFPDIPLKKIFLGTAPFLVANLVAVLAIVLFPEIAMLPLAWLG
ncbi:TRAP transporter large permease [Halomonas sp. M5N1S17]|uniref:TRAP transporter large permease n=1 Tax=Halomonas alkalisoli TaxID=2907158 RepID=UPI001F414DA8|nr:TRAP transporter large permease [Halomonas alkalisoli]MCE9664694.1 TRAP transporter large permease [Halomonas alkalisoli]